MIFFKKKRKFKDSFRKEKKKNIRGELAVDAYQDSDYFVVRAPIGGVKEDEITVSIENEILIIKGERKEPKIEDLNKFYISECYWGPFFRKIALPKNLDFSKVSKEIKNGILLVKIPRTKPSKN